MGHLIGLDPEDYICGHWRPYLIAELMWVSSSSTSRPLSGFSSWSWLSIDGGIINGCSWAYSCQQWQPIAEFLEPIFQSKRPNTHFGSASIRLRGPACQAIISTPEISTYDPVSGSCWTIAIGEYLLHEGNHFILSLDERNDAAVSRICGCELLLFLCGTTVSTRHLADPSFRRYDELASDRVQTARLEFEQDVRIGTTAFSCLVLKPVDDPGTFQRVGAIEFVGEPQIGLLAEVFYGAGLANKNHGDVNEKIMREVILM